MTIHIHPSGATRPDPLDRIADAINQLADVFDEALVDGCTPTLTINPAALEQPMTPEAPAGWRCPECEDWVPDTSITVEQLLTAIEKHAAEWHGHR